MAGWSGAVSCSNGNQAYSLRLYVVETSTSVENNTSSLTWWLDMYSVNGYYSVTGAAGNFVCTINGQTVVNRNITWSVGGNSGTRIANGTMTVSHNADGTKSFNVSASYRTTVNYGVYTPNNGSLSGTMTLSTIPRATAVTLDLSNGTVMGNTISITGTPASSSFSHKIYYQFNSGTETLIAETASGSVSESWTIPTDLAEEIPNSETGTVSIVLKTYNGSTLIGTKSTSFTTTVPEDYLPTITGILIEEANANIPSSWGFFIQNQSKLKITVSASGSHGSTITTISESIDGNTYTDTAVDGVASVTTNTLTSAGNLSATVKVTDSRGRSISMADSIQVEAYSIPTMSNLSASRADSAYKIDEVDGTYALFGYNYNVTSLNGKNSFSFRIQYKKKSASSWKTATTVTSVYSVENGTFQGGNIFDSTSNYDVRFGIKDYFSSEYTCLQTSVSETYTLMNYGADGKAVAFFGQSSNGINEVEVVKGTVSVNNGRLDINNDDDEHGKVYMNGTYWLDIVYPVGSIYTSVNSTNPANLFGGTWEQIAQGCTLIGVGTGTDVNGTSQSFTSGASGGEYTHRITYDEMCNHNHWQYSNITSVEAGGYGLTASSSFQNRVVISADVANNNTPSITFSGKSAGHNNIQPYLAVYFFERIA